MPGFSESNITLNFPDNNHFRFSNCPAYSVLSANNFKEVDACWYEQANNIYWLFELKDYSLATLDANTIDKRAWDIVKKAVDSLCMFLSSKHSYPFSAVLDPCLPVVPNDETQFKFVTVVHCIAAQKADIQLINQKFKTRFKPYAQLSNIQHYAVVEHSSAVRNIPHNIVI